MDRATAIRRLRACLRLSKSSNAHEAAAALRQAQKLQIEFDLDDLTDGSIDSTHEYAKTRNRGRELPDYISVLAKTCADAFRCLATEILSPGETRIIFVGIGTGPEICAYSFAVLRRQIERDTARHTRRVRKTVVKKARALAFGLGWCDAVRELLVPNYPGQIDLMIFGKYTAHLLGGEGTLRPRNDWRPGALAENDYMGGRAAGANAKLHKGVEVSQGVLEHLT